MSTHVEPRTNSLPPPEVRYTLLGWLHKNLFSTWFNSILTILALGLILAILVPLANWLIYEAEWEVIQVNFRLLMVGLYPAAETWRVWACLFLLAVILGLTWGVWAPRRWILGLVFLLAPVLLSFLPVFRGAIHWQLFVFAGLAALGYLVGRAGGKRLVRPVITVWVLFFPLVILLIRGLALPGDVLTVVPTNLWGGLLLTFLLTIVGISFSFPLGVLLALGRRSSLPVIRWASISYIEVIRGVPLVTILFMASTMVPLFFPLENRPDPVLRAMIGITLFSAAYMAEIVRAGLQAIPRGQFEAAHALGLSSFQTTTFIILPQALRLVIPVLVGLFIALFKDTSLVVIIGILELLGIARSVLAQPQYISYQREVYLFVALIYWIFSYGMSYLSQRMEAALGVGDR